MSSTQSWDFGGRPLRGRSLATSYNRSKVNGDDSWRSGGLQPEVRVLVVAVVALLNRNAVGRRAVRRRVPVAVLVLRHVLAYAQQRVALARRAVRAHARGRHGRRDRGGAVRVGHAPHRRVGATAAATARS